MARVLVDSISEAIDPEQQTRVQLIVTGFIIDFNHQTDRATWSVHTKTLYSAAMHPYK